MQTVVTFMTVVAGLILSLAAVLAEELIFGQVLRLFFARNSVPQLMRQTAAMKAGEKR